ncbi:MAG: hypothetical protein EOP38_25200, partial [Rubrivivax sp.]
MSTEARRQAAVLQALQGHETDAPEGETSLVWLEQGPRLAQGLAAYQGNARATAEKALASAYPTVQAMLGDEALAVLARQLWHQHPPGAGDLALWGQALPEWLASLSEVQAWPYLPDCARLDWARHTAELAFDVTFDAASLALLGEADPAHLTLQLRPGLSLIATNWPVVSLWEAHQASEPVLDAVRTALAEARAETAVVWRREWRAEVVALPGGMRGWMQALAAPPSTVQPPPLQTLLDQADPDFDFSAWLA